MNILLCSNWTFGTTELITLLGTVATFFAVLIALWQTTSSRKCKIKLKLSFVSVVTPHINETIDYINLSVTNVGYIPVKIYSWYFFIGKTKLYVLNNEISGVANTSFPLLLNTSEDGSFFFKQEKFFNVMQKFKDDLKTTNVIKTGCYLSNTKLITINVKLTKLFGEKSVEDIYKKLENK